MTTKVYPIIINTSRCNPEVEDCSFPLWLIIVLSCIIGIPLLCFLIWILWCLIRDFCAYLSNTRCFIFIREKIKCFKRKEKTNPTPEDNIEV